MSYARLSTHGAMLFDERRNALYAEAIRRSVTPGSVVLDLGAGVGLHGLLAAAAGARRTFLVEPQPVVHLARQAAQRAGLADRVEILQSRIEEVSLPEPVDLIVSVLTGNLLFSEDLLPSLFHARDRYLKPGGLLLPQRARLRLAPLHAPGLHAKHVASWSTPVMGMDFSAGRGFAGNEILWLLRRDYQGAHSLAPGALMVELDMAAARDGGCDAVAACRVAEPGECHGLVGWIELELAGEWLSTAPDAPPVHWSPTLLPIDPPLQLQAGETVELALHRPARGDWTWSIHARAGARRHSSFLGHLEGPRELRRLAPDSRPGLSEGGRRTARILGWLAGGMSNREAAQALAAEEGMDAQQALREVQSAAARHGGG